MIVPHLTRFVSECHKMGMVVEMHSCGFIEELIPNLISTGIDTWPGQGICDKRKLIRLYGDQFKFSVLGNPPTPPASIEEAKQFARDLYDEFRDKMVVFWCHPQKCGGPENYQAVIATLVEEGKKQFASA